MESRPFDNGWKLNVSSICARFHFMLIYLLRAIDIPPWALMAIDKVRRGFLWRGRKDAQGGHCLLAWLKLTFPLELGGLGIFNLQNLGWALHMRWLWLRKTEPDRPWATLPIQVQSLIRAFFSMPLSQKLEVVKRTLFLGQTDYCMVRIYLPLCLMCLHLYLKEL